MQTRYEADHASWAYSHLWIDYMTLCRLQDSLPYNTVKLAQTRVWHSCIRLGFKMASVPYLGTSKEPTYQCVLQ